MPEHGRLIGVVLLAAALSLAPGSASGQSFFSPLGPIEDDSGFDFSDEWDDVDAAVDLTGIWGSIDPYRDADPHVHVRPDGEIYLLWGHWDGVFHQIYYASRPAGGSWSAPNPIEPIPGNTVSRRHPTATTDYAGRLHVAWLLVGNFGDVVHHSLKLSGPWTTPLPLTGPQLIRGVSLQPVGSTVHAVYWTRLEITTLEITVVVSSGGSDDVDPDEVTVESEHLFTTLRPLF